VGAGEPLGARKPDSPEPEPFDPFWPRYGDRPFPGYRFVPGQSPHPCNDPRGHSFGLPPERIEAPVPERWQDCEPFRFAIDLFNQAYWWECHEVLEALWNAAGRHTPQGRFFQGLIQVAAAHLKRFQGVDEPARALAERGLAKLVGLPPRYMGVDVVRLRADTQAHFAGERRQPVLIALADG